MANRQLSKQELEAANTLLNRIRSELIVLSNGNADLLFAYRRKIYKELTYDERSKPMVRKKLKELKRKQQRGLCALCGKELPEKYAVLDRLNAVDGYTENNTRLIHPDCDITQQRIKKYA